MKKSFFSHLTHLFLISFFTAFILIACQKNEHINTDSNVKLEFSNDSIVFDTVFSTIGSITKQLRVYNKSDNRIIISSIRLLGGESSQYRINVDGSSNLFNEDVELDAYDSLFIFVRVSINPNLEDAPFIVTDKIEFLTNGNEQSIELVAWGQNANYIIGNQLNQDGKLFKIVVEKDQEISWDSPKPYIIYGMAKIDTNAILRIPEGCRIYFHNQSGIWVAPNACIKMTGTLLKPISLKGDRLDESYRDLPGQWEGIILEGSDQTTEINYAIIENATFGIKAKTTDLTKSNQLLIRNTIIQNMTESGITSQAFSIQSNNSLIANCAYRLLDIQAGGTIDFKQCTFANYWAHSLRLNASIFLSNSFSNEQQSLNNNLNASFGNCIIEGRNNDEIELNSQVEAGFEILFSYSSLKTQLESSTTLTLDNCFKNPENIFNDPESSTFKLNAESVLIDAGLLSIGQMIPLDLFGNSRLPLPDIGAIEFVEEEEK